MNQTTNTALGRKQLIAIVLVLLLGGAGAVAILGARPASESGHGHDEAKGHADEEHHGEETDGHDHAEGGEHHEEPAEGSVAMTAGQIKAAGIAVETAGPAVLRATLRLPGEIGFNEDRTAHVVPRVTGVVEAVPVALGQAVKKGQVLAVIGSSAVSELRAELQAATTRQQLARSTHEREKALWEQKISPQQDVLQAEAALREAEIAVNNARQKLQAVGARPGTGNLNRFELRAPFDGTVVEKHISLGEQVREDTQVFTLSDLRTVWARIDVPARDLPRVRVGEQIRLRASAFDQVATGRVAYVGSLIGEQTRTAQARMVVDNPKALWRPGLFVDVEVSGDETPVPVAVAADAIQTVGNQSVVFVRTEAGFAARPVSTGRADGARVEVVKGLSAGDRYAAAGSFVVKSEAGKASATHSH
jgi:cobalt-zinc-cadmium efflux system membrane fusion protein